MAARDDLRSPIRHGFNLPGHRAVGTVDTSPRRQASTPPVAENYRREARRLRERYAGQPELLHSSLRNLSRQHDRAHRPAEQSVEAAPLPKLRPIVERVRRAAPPPPQQSLGHAVVNWFADRVAATVDSRLMLFSERHALLKTAERLGIDRFHANLIVAVAQHQAEQRESASAPQPAKSKRSLAPLVLIVAVQALIVSAGWWILRGA